MEKKTTKFILLKKMKTRHPEKVNKPANPIKPKPSWIRSRLSNSQEFFLTKTIVNKHNLKTVCQEANCPNITDCWSKRHATFLIMGNICTRACAFCDVITGKPKSLDPLEPFKIAKAIRKLNLKHAVITSVDRDDLKDGGASIWVETINTIRKVNPTTTMETLIPDFKGKLKDIQPIIDAKPEVVSHNLETVRSLTRKVRIQAKYDRSLDTLRYLYEGGIRTKSGIMLGLGEKEEEVIESMKDLRNVGVKILTLGQYLQPSKKHLPVVEFITPEKFAYFKEVGLSLGFEHVESSPLVRSSYHAEKHI